MPSPAQSRVVPRPGPSADKTRANLLQKALTLFAQDGLKGVSLRRIVSASGAANPSALHYHFGDRWALVTAIAAQVFGQLTQQSLQRLAALGERPRSVRAVLEAVYMPLVMLREQEPGGRDAVRFMARLSWEFGREGQALSSNSLAPLANAALAQLEKLLPEKSPDAIRLHLAMSMTNVFHGLADFEYLEIAPFGPGGLLGAARKRQRLEAFFDFLEGGVRSLPRAGAKPR